ncbi:hypothetical protein LEP1GSC188_4735 [Leptospira weilii serovar Topaz str. LT2116]|uniref:Uncharacterized protein n=4 Tax=Leptospira weilii TaxID=28184 RepID=M3H0I9_9LEPT|nr:hypothetical protein LEP1GSC036_0755 [Leptospira weilii str. 2006001853]EMF82255.1 hypothetical protein LEP1GSC188_4735 [Leptospira weilii serovar Topaz str. LT2116]EMJ62711.1 hypothetical protein LEP1GSC051_3935 [Leptospira sp. P2653]EMM74972.1 hypothetical protein LEP1GSC038_0910 [Leptospira weilii str. 2006001855]EMN46689.1 hypothetical protein LEP1GSC086_4087 [Leptospira weilii str. LNT 1234]EMN90775.1 hypothetical protein LEP1GSC108_2323 [Leptospira weilii str. UI 13098]
MRISSRPRTRFFLLKTSFSKNRILRKIAPDEPIEIYGKPFGPLSEILP